MAVVGVPNSGVFEEDIGALSAGDSAGKDSVSFLKRVMIARQLAGEFRSRREYLRASDLLAGLHRRGAPSELGEWLGERSALRVLIGTAVLQKQQDLVDWLLNASKADFNVVLDKAYIERPKIDGVEDVVAASMDLEEGDEPLFFIDTTKSYHMDGAEGGFDADEEFVVAAGRIQADTKDDVLFDRSEQLERKRTRVAAKPKAGKAKQRKSSNGAKAGEDSSDFEDMSEDESEDESSMSE
jgi:hypothetical protein